MTTVVVPPPAPFPAGGRRLIIYVVYDRRGEVDDYVPRALRGLREHCSHLLVVVNGEPVPLAHAVLAEIADDVLVRENTGFDIWGYKAGLDHVGDALGEFDEVVLVNDTWFGPVRPFGPLFDRMDARPLHLWGMTDHPQERPNPFTQSGVMPRHLQSFWVAARREAHQSAVWARYWSQLPAISTYNDAILLHEIVFTEHFVEQGFVAEAAYPAEDYPTPHPAIFNADLLLADGCPIVKRRPLFHYPPFLSRNAVIGRQLVAAIAGHGYPIDLIWQSLARNVPPKTLNTDEGMLEVLSDAPGTAEGPSEFRLAAVVHVGQGEDAGEILDRLHMIGERFDLFVTVADDAAMQRIEDRVRGSSRLAERIAGLQVLPAPADDMAALMVTLRGRLDPARYDLMVKLHAGAPADATSAYRRYFRRYQRDNLLDSPTYVRRMMDLFVHEPGLGVVFPAPIRIGDPPFRRAWPAYRARVQALATQLGIRVPLDDLQPLAPTGGMWIARPEALAILLDARVEEADYLERGADGEPALSRMQQVLVPLAAGERGYHCRTVLTAEHAAINHTSLEFVLDELSAATLGYPVDQIEFMQRAAWSGDARALTLARVYMRVSHPDLARAWLPAFDRARSAVRAVRGRLPRRIRRRSDAGEQR